MKALLLTLMILILSSCIDKFNRNELKLIKSIKLEENDSAFISNINNLSFLSDGSFIINSSETGNAILYDSIGKIIKNYTFDLNLIDSMKFYFDINNFVQRKGYELAPLAEVLNTRSKKFESVSMDSFKVLANNLYKRRIVKSIVINDQKIMHLVKITNLMFKGKQYGSFDHPFIIITNPYEIIECFLPTTIKDNGDPYFPLYDDLAYSVNSKTYYLNTFNEYYNMVARNTNNALKFNFYSISAQNNNYSKLELKTPLPRINIMRKVFYNMSKPIFLTNDEGELLYCFPLIDTLFNLDRNKSYPLNIITSNEYFFYKFDYDDYERMNYKRLGFNIETLSIRENRNIIISTRIFNNYKENDASLTNILVQEYNPNLTLLKSNLIPFQRKEYIENQKATAKYVCSLPSSNNIIVVAYFNNENWFIDYYEW